MNALFQHIKGCFEGLIENALFPRERRMVWIEEAGIRGMSSENVRFVINEVVRTIPDCTWVPPSGMFFVEVGSYQGCSLLSAVYKNYPPFRNFSFLAIDDFSEFGDNQRILEENIKKHTVDNCTIQFIRGDYKTVIPEYFKLFKVESCECIDDTFLKTVDVYLYDGNHSYQEQLTGLNIIKPYLSDKCVIIVDDAAWHDPHRANMDWLKENPDFETMFISHYTPEEWVRASEDEKIAMVNHPTWWNGIRLFSRGF